MTSFHCNVPGVSDGSSLVPHGMSKLCCDMHEFGIFFLATIDACEILLSIVDSLVVASAP